MPPRSAPPWPTSSHRRRSASTSTPPGTRSASGSGRRRPGRRGGGGPAIVSWTVHLQIRSTDRALAPMVTGTMTARSVDPDGTPRLATRLAAAWRARFVGRHAELELFRAAVRASEPPFAALFLYGPGGIGKTALLAEYARIATEAGVPVLRFDGRDL